MVMRIIPYRSDTVRKGTKGHQMGPARGRPDAEVFGSEYHIRRSPDIRAYLGRECEVDWTGMRHPRAAWGDSTAG
jgi:hypothetical protein